MTSLQRAIISVIHQVWNYRFVGSEKKAADRMVKKKLLKPLSDGRYMVTAAGEFEYKEDGRYKF